MPKILYEDPNLLVINKPAGLLVHGIYHHGHAKHNEPTLTDLIAKKYPEIKNVGDVPSQRGGIVHRLDRETSGVMIIARTQAAFEYLKKLFQEKTIKKTYLALVWGKVKDAHGVIDKPISIKDGSVKRTVYKGKMTREAVTEYEVLKYFSASPFNNLTKLLNGVVDKLNEFSVLTLLKITPKTGRTHQIRVHLASIGHPIVGDKLYGRKSHMSDVMGQMLPPRQFLHAESIEFPLMNGKRITVAADLPDDLANFLSQTEEFSV